MSGRLGMKKLICAMMVDALPDFAIMPEKRTGYWFYRAPRYLFHDFVVIQSSQKHKCLAADVATIVYPDWDCQYCWGPTGVATSLANLRCVSRGTPMEEEEYYHDGTESGARETVRRIGDELRRYASPLFDEHMKRAKTDPLLQFGLRWVAEHLGDIPADIARQLDDAAALQDYRRDRVKNPLLDRLKEDLRRYAATVNAPKEQRQGTLVIAWDLLHCAHTLKTD